MFDMEKTDLDEDDELPGFELPELEVVNDKLIENEDVEVCSINDVEEALIDADGEI